MVQAVDEDLLAEAYEAFADALDVMQDNAGVILNRIQSATGADTETTIALFRRLVALQNLVETEGFLPAIIEGERFTMNAIAVAAVLDLQEVELEPGATSDEFDRGMFLAELARRSQEPAGSA